MVISVNFLRFSQKFLSRISENVRKCFLDGKEDKYIKTRNFQIFEKISFIAFDKIGGNYVLPANSIKICLLGYFCMQNSNL